MSGLINESERHWMCSIQIMIHNTLFCRFGIYLTLFFTQQFQKPESRIRTIYLSLTLNYFQKRCRAEDFRSADRGLHRGGIQLTNSKRCICLAYPWYHAKKVETKVQGALRKKTWLLAETRKPAHRIAQLITNA